MPRVLLAWEAGAGRGHVVRLQRIAALLQAPEHVDAALCRMDHADELSGVCDAVFQGARFAYDRSERMARGVPVTATWAEFLADMGFRQADALSRQIGWWREVIEARRIGLVIGDFAPCVILAARSLGIASVGIGTGYHLPPPSLTAMPPLLPEHTRLAYDEAEMVAAINAAGAAHGLEPIRYFAQLHACDDQLVVSLPLLDPYADHRTAPYIPVDPFLTSQGHGERDEIFVYFSTQEYANPALMEAIGSLGLPTRMVLAGAPEGVVARLAGRPDVIIEPRPIAPGEIIRRSRMILHAGQHGTLCIGLAGGLTHVAAPQQMEQAFNARRVEAEGVLRCVDPQMDAGAIRAMIQATYHDDAMQARAAGLARALAPHFSQPAAPAIRARLDAVMARYA